MNATEEQIISAMTEYGGAFVRQLAKLYTVADPINREKLRKTFSTEWKHYIALALHKVETPQ